MFRILYLINITKCGDHRMYTNESNIYINTIIPLSK